MSYTKYPEEIILSLPSFVRKLLGLLKQGEECQFYCDPNVLSFDRRKNVMIFSFLVPWIINNMNDIASIIFGSSYTTIQNKNNTEWSLYKRKICHWRADISICLKARAKKNFI